MMLLEIYPCSKNLSSGSVLETSAFQICDNFPWLKYSWAVCTVLCFAFGFPASVAILWDLFKTHRRGTPFTPSNFFILNLTIMDVVFLAFIPPGLLNYLIWQSWSFEVIWDFVYSFNTCGRPLLMASACLDCYLAVVHPITYHKKKSLTPRVTIVAIIWTLTAASGIVFCLSLGIFYTMFYTVPFIIAIVIIGICDVFIFHALVKSDPGKKNIHPKKQRAIQMLVNSLVITVISYLPPVLLVAIGKPLISDLTTFMCTIGLPGTITSASGSAVMPLLHINNQGKFSRFRFGCCKKS